MDATVTILRGGIVNHLWRQGREPFGSPVRFDPEFYHHGDLPLTSKPACDICDSMNKIWNNCVVWGLAEGENVEVSIGYATLADVGDGVLTGATTDGDESAW